LRRYDPRSVEFQVRTEEIAKIICHEHVCTASDSQLDQVIVTLVSQIGSPPTIYIDQCTFANEDIEQDILLGRIQPGVPEASLSIQNVFIFQEESPADNRLDTIRNADLDDFRRCASPDTSADEHVCIDDDPHPPVI
jgi:hypothetical protein